VVGTCLHVQVGAGLADLGDQLEFGQFLNQLARQRGALPNQHNHIRIAQTHGQLTHAFDCVGVDLGVEPVQAGSALEFADRVLVVVQDDDVQHSACFLSA